MLRVTAKVVGVDNVKKSLQNMISDEKIEKILDYGAALIEAEAKRLCPVDTGRLRASINTIKPRKLVRSIGTSVEYAPYVEFGTYKMRAQPYLRPALEHNIDKIRAMLVKTLK